MKINTSKSGYSLVEMLIVIAIIGILATLASVSLKKVANNTRDAKRLADMSSLRRSLELYKLYNNNYPPSVNFQPGMTLNIPGDSRAIIKFPRNPYGVGGVCPMAEYQYFQDLSGQSYHIRFCLDAKTQQYPAGKCDTTPKDVCEIVP